ncbi:MAG: hypothetical protein N3C62_00210 [Synergistetes bacterium]|nr:hypothetical protein [Synergistota bacterium]MCX8127160.1 hypothetical protein [Synergistota bacterium]MDW8191954.1 hypothetical protein [Synergistota bacterium]
MGLDILKLLKDNGVYSDHWQESEDFPFYHTRVEKESRLAEEVEFHEIPLSTELWKSWLIDKSRKPRRLEKVIFIDGVRKIHRRLHGLDGSEGCIAEIVIGHVIWGKDYIRTCKDPLIKRFLILSGSLVRRILEREAYFPTLERFPFEIVELASEGEDRISKSVNNLLLNEERAYLGEMVLKREGFIIKDGTMHPGSPTFIGREYGPVGLVKRIIKEHLSQDFLSLVQSLRKGERTPFYTVYLRETEDILRVMCYLRLIDIESGENPIKGIVRLETLVLRRDFESGDKRDILKREISEAFDSLALFISSMTMKGCNLPRSPENLPIVYSLESYLSSFFLWNSYLSSLLKKGGLS